MIYAKTRVVDGLYTVKCFNEYGVDITASLDRIDSLKGYTEDNVQWVHKHINFMKGSLSENKFIEYCKLIVKNNEL